MKSSGGRGPYLSLAPHCALKRLEAPGLYDIKGDELYELDEEGLAFLAACPPIPGASDDSAARDFARFCLDEGICLATASRSPLALPPRPPLPTLRYLLVHVTGRCNLRCRHCFLGEAAEDELEAGDVLRLAGEFAGLQGLRFILSGGEPLLHRRFWEINERLGDYPFRSILLTNGTLIDRAAAKALRFHEVQVSIDGLEGSHELLRGPGSHRRALEGLARLAEEGRADLSVATMVHAANLGEFDALGEVLSSFPLRSWSVDVPCLTGSFAAHGTLAAPPEEAAARMVHSFGGGYYGSSGPWACGPHLAAVMADGAVAKCGHYGDRPEGTIAEGLETVWRRLRRVSLDDLRCRCSHLPECRGGCRYRAELFSCQGAPDPIQCFARGVPLGGDRIEERTGDNDRPKGGERE